MGRGRLVVFAATFAVLVSGWLAAQAGAFVYWGSDTAGGIGRANLDGSGARTLTGPLLDDPAVPGGVAVDGQHVYWTEPLFSLIRDANLNGTADDGGALINFVPPTLVGIAVDGQHLYWTNQTTGAIGRANLDGTGADQSFITGASAPSGVAVDGQHIYWTNPNSGSGTIGRANLDGTGVDQNFITPGIPVISGVAVDELSPPPTVVLTAPAQDARFAIGQVVDSSFTCTEGGGGPGLASCLDQNGNGPGAALDTSTTGLHTITATATSKDGQTATATRTYRVAAAPTASITSPANGATYAVGQVVDSSFTCNEGAGGPGIGICSGTVPDGGTVDTTTVGTHTFTVTATSNGGLTGSVSSTYTVLAPLPPLAAAPVLRGLKGSHARWRDGKRLAQISSQNTRKRPPVGTTFSFSLNVPATVKLAFAEKHPGRRVSVRGKRRCVAQTEHNKRLRRCVRALAAGRVSLKAHSGANKIVFAGRINPTSKLKPGSYTVTITATNAAGSSRARSLRFTIVK